MEKRGDVTNSTPESQYELDDSTASRPIQDIEVESSLTATPAVRSQATGCTDTRDVERG